MIQILERQENYKSLYVENIRKYQEYIHCILRKLIPEK